MENLKWTARAFACVVLLVLGACSDSSESGISYATGPHDHAVGMTSRTFVDTSRPTSAHGPVPEMPSRTIDTTIVYPAEGTPGSASMPDAPVDGMGAPYPLIVLSHGLGGYPGYLVPLAEVWASRGYVVALPRFPLTSRDTAGGPVAQDTQNQPADVSFVIDALLAESRSAGSLLNNAVDDSRFAASGHSNGGITSYGIAAHTCCRDDRIDAVVILAGVAGPYTGGEYDFVNAPPTFVFHGVHDLQLSYNQSVSTYNELHPPKGFLSLEESDHGSFLSADDPAFALVALTAADFLDGVLRDDGAAFTRLAETQAPGIATMHWAPDDASNIPVETLPEPETNRQAFLSADSGLTDGQVITVTWSGYLPGTVVNVMQCSGEGTSSTACNISGGRILHPDPEGMGSLELVIRTGPIGDGVCDSANPCLVIVNDASLLEEEATVRIPITFAD